MRIKVRYVTLPKDQRGSMESEAAKFNELGQRLAITAWGSFVISIGLLVVSRLRRESETPILFFLLFIIFILIQMIRV